jgi:hypothetical protein
MEWLFWLALLRGGAEALMAAPPTVQERMAAIRTHRWLSPREKLERLLELDGMGVTGEEAEGLLDRSLTRFFFGGWGGGGYCVPGLDDLRWSQWGELPVWNRPGGQFLIVKGEAARIREQDLPHAEKLRRLLQLVRPGMTAKQLHLLFGEPERVVYSFGTDAKVFYPEWGVTILVDADGNVAEVNQDRDSWWELAGKVLYHGDTGWFSPVFF